MRIQRWLPALAVAMVLHLAVFASLDPRSFESGAQAPGRDGLLVSLAPAGGSPGTPAAAPPETDPQSESIPEPEPEPRTRPRPEPESEPDPRVVEAEPEPAPEAEPQSEPVPESEPEPQPKHEPKTEQAAPEQMEQVAGQQARAGSGAGSEAAATDGAAGGGDPGARRDYLARIQALLARHREYPRRARMRRIEGTVRVRFMLHPDGRLTDIRIIRSSGSELLDRATREMLLKATPLPPFPADMEPQAFSLQLPIEYALR